MKPPRTSPSFQDNDLSSSALRFARSSAGRRNRQLQQQQFTHTGGVVESPRRPPRLGDQRASEATHAAINTTLFSRYSSVTHDYLRHGKGSAATARGEVAQGDENGPTTSTSTTFPSARINERDAELSVQPHPSRFDVHPPRTAPQRDQSMPAYNCSHRPLTSSGHPTSHLGSAPVPATSRAPRYGAATVAAAHTTVEPDFVNIHSSGRKRTPFAGSMSVSSYTHQINRQARELIFAATATLRAQRQSSPSVTDGTSLLPNQSKCARDGKRRPRTAPNEKVDVSPTRNPRGIFSLTQPDHRTPVREVAPVASEEAEIDDTSGEQSEGTVNNGVDDPVVASKADAKKKVSSCRRQFKKSTTINLPPPTRLESLMQERHSDVLLGGGRKFLSLRNIEDRVGFKINLLHANGDARDEVIRSARRVQSARVGAFRSKNWLLSAVDAAVDKVKGEFSATHPDTNGGPLPDVASSPTKNPDSGTVAATPAEPLPQTHNINHSSSAVKVPAHIIQTVTRQARQQAIERAQEAHMRDGATWHSMNVARQDAHHSRLVHVAEERVVAIMESVTRHDRVVHAANAQRERLEHSDLKARWCTAITLATYQRMLNDRALQVVTCRNIHYHDQFFRKWYHAWVDPTAMRVHAEKRRLRRARLFLAVILARMWGFIIVKRRRVLLIRQSVQDIRHSSSLALAVHVFHTRLSVVFRAVRKFLFLRGYNLGLLLLQWKKAEREYRHRAHDAAIEALQARQQEEEALSKSRAGRAEKQARLESVAKMTADQRDHFKAGELVKNDLPNYLNGDELPFSLIAERIHKAWHDQRVRFLRETQGVLWRQDQQEYNKRLLAQKGMRAGDAPSPRAPRLRPPPHLLPASVVSSLVEDAFTEYNLLMGPIKKKAALRVIKRGMECDYNAVKDKLKSLHFGEHRKVVRERYVASFGMGICVGGVVEEESVAAFLMVMARSELMGDPGTAADQPSTQPQPTAKARLSPSVLSDARGGGRPASRARTQTPGSLSTRPQSSRTASGGRTGNKSPPKSGRVGGLK